MLDRKYIISPPFGTYLRHKNAYSVIGSFTVNQRLGRLKQVLSTVRPISGGWVNNIGLRNPGIDSVKAVLPHQIISFAPLQEADWSEFERFLDGKDLRVEFNVSCPNIGHNFIKLPKFLPRILSSTQSVIFKLPPLIGSVDFALHLADRGVKYIHLSNTLPSATGGISGRQLREANLPIAERAARVLTPSAQIIAGGGIYSVNDLQQYINVGAAKFSLATAFFWPPRAYRILNV